MFIQCSFTERDNVKNFFSDKSLEELVDMIVGIGAVFQLFPSPEAYARLYELEQEGKDVEGSIKIYFGGKLLRRYQAFKSQALLLKNTPRKRVEEVGGKFSPIETIPLEGVDWVSATMSEPYRVAAYLCDKFGTESSEFLKMYFLQVYQGRTVFTRMFEANQLEMMEKYREWLYKKSPDLQLRPQEMGIQDGYRARKGQPRHSYYHAESVIGKLMQKRRFDFQSNLLKGIPDVQC